MFRTVTAAARGGRSAPIPIDDAHSHDGLIAELSPEEYAAAEKKLLRKIDLRIMPCLFIIIIMNYLDRNALSNARVQGIEKDLGLEHADFNTAISVFFAGYLVMQIPSNLILTRVRPSLYLPGCMAAWGIVSGLTACVHDYKGLVVVRFFLGFVEAPYFPGALFLLSTWYTRKELALRTSFLYAGSLLSGGFGGLVGAGIQYGMNGLNGLQSWRWLFIIEAAVTVFIAICVMFILPDYPHSTRSFTPLERAIAVNRMRHASGAKDEERGSPIQGLKMAVTDYKTWLLALIIITKTSAGAVTSFIPTVINTFGYSKVTTLLLVAPPYVFATICALIISFTSDKLGERAFHIVVPIFVAMAGYIMAAASMTLAVRYLAIFLMLGGVYGSYNVALAWISSTLPRPLEKRAAAIALINTVGNLAQIYSPYLYIKSMGPRYIEAMSANSCFCLACLFATLVLRWCLKRENAKLDRLEAEGVVAMEKIGKGDTEAEMYEEKVESVPATTGYRYVL